MKTNIQYIITGLLVVFLGALSCLPAYGAPDPNFHIYLMIGQSNMAGAGTIEAQDRVSHPKVQVLQDISCSSIPTAYGQWRAATPPLIYCPGGLGPGDYFGRAMGDAAQGNVTIGLVGAAYPGAAIEYFLKDCASRNTCEPPFGPVAGAPNNGSSGYLWIMDLAKKAQEKGVIRGIIFHQGESNTGNRAQWPGLVNEMVTDIRKDLGLKASEVPFIAAELVCCGMNDAVHQLASVVENGHWVSAEGLTRKDDFHMDTESNREMGRRFGAKMLEVSSTALLSCGTQGGVPVCCNILADLSGDGFGEQDGGVCVVTEDSDGWHPPNPSDVIAAINVGGSESVQFDQVWFEPDHFFVGGTPGSTAAMIAGAAGSTLFQTERYGSFRYEIPVQNGAYSVQLGMAEIYQGNPGLRSFDVVLENVRVISSLDLYQEVGGNTVFLSSIFTTEVSDGRLDIDVTKILDNGTLASILVRKASAASSSSSITSTQSSVSSSSSAAGSTGGVAGSVDQFFVFLSFVCLVLRGYLSRIAVSPSSANTSGVEWYKFQKTTFYIIGNK